MTETRMRYARRMRLEPRVEADIDPVPKIGFHKASQRFVVNSRGLALCIAHKHFNITATARLVQQTRPDLAGEFFWDKYHAQTGRWLPCVYLARNALIAMFGRLHNVPGCRDIDAVLRRYLVLLDEAEAPAEPAPDTEIRPPERETADLFTPPEPVEDPAPSWEINAAIRLLRRRTTLPRYLGDDLDGWNLSRCKAAAERTKDIDEIAAIYATSKPK